MRRFARDPLLGETLRQIRGLRPMRTATVAQALLRAVAGQLIQAKRAREIERTVIRATSPQLGQNRPKKKKKSGGGGPNPFLIIGVALVAGIALAKWVDWRGHAHPRD